MDRAQKALGWWAGLQDASHGSGEHNHIHTSDPSDYHRRSQQRHRRGRSHGARLAQPQKRRRTAAACEAPSRGERTRGGCPSAQRHHAQRAGDGNQHRPSVGRDADRRRRRQRRPERRRRRRQRRQRRKQRRTGRAEPTTTTRGVELTATSRSCAAARLDRRRPGTTRPEPGPRVAARRLPPRVTARLRATAPRPRLEAGRAR